MRHIAFVLVILAAVMLFGLSGCIDVGGLVGGGKNCTNETVMKTVCRNETVKEPYTEKGNCVTKPYEEKECTDEPIGISVGTPIVTSRLLIDQGRICNVSAAVVVSNPELEPVNVTMRFIINDEGVMRYLNDTKTIKARGSEDFRVRFISKWDCGNEARKPSAELSYEYPKKQVCSMKAKVGEVCENVTKYRESVRESCSEVPVEVKKCA